MPDNFLDKYILTSAKEDLTSLEDEIIKTLGLNPNSELVLITNKRHEDAIKKTDQCIDNAKDLLNASNESIDLLALEVRSGLGELSELVGATPNEDILGRIFSKFCIGK